MNSSIVSSSLTGVGTLNNLTIASPASVTSNSATDKYLDVGTKGQLFDDGNFHLHAKTDNLWLNALSGNIFIGEQYNTSTPTYIIAKTPHKSKTNYNQALATEIAIDNVRYRIANSGGIFPQVISNTAGTLNVSWVAVATLNGVSITFNNNTGTSIPNNSWTSLFTSHGMDAAGDMVIVTLTDKNNGIVHRVTFMRNDDGATTGYSIFVERLW